jgi:hypothetical protein
VKLIEDSSRAILDIGSCQYSDAIFGEFRCKLRSALSIFESTNPRRDCRRLSAGPSTFHVTICTFPRLQQMRMGFIDWLPELRFRLEGGAVCSRIEGRTSLHYARDSPASQNNPTWPDRLLYGLEASSHSCVTPDTESGSSSSSEVKSHDDPFSPASRS